MYIIIAGSGLVGSHIASLLSETKHEVAVVEQSEETIEAIRNQLDVTTIHGNAIIPRVLKELEVDRADLVIAVTGSDETNMVICFVAKGLGAKMTVARVRNPEYSGYFIGAAKSTTSRKLIRPRTFGVDLFINPVTEAAKEIASILTSLYASPMVNFSRGLAQIREFPVEKATLVGQHVSDIVFPKPCKIVAILRAEGVFIPQPEEEIKAGDHIYLLTSRKDINELGGMFTQPQRPARSVVILGGGRVGCLIAGELLSRNISVKIIERSPGRCQEVASNLKGMVIQGDGTDRDLLVEQGVPQADAFVASTENDETNILTALLAKSLGVPRNMILVNKPSNIPLAEAVGVDVAASAPLITSRKITNFVLHGRAISVALLGGEQIQAIEFVAGPEAPIVEQRLSQAVLPAGVIAGAIVRGEQVIIPPDGRTVRPDDRVIVIAPLAAVAAVERLFA